MPVTSSWKRSSRQSPSRRGANRTIGARQNNPLIGALNRAHRHWMEFLGFRGRLCLRDSLLELAREMRHNAELPLDQHELRTVMHFVLFSA